MNRLHLAIAAAITLGGAGFSTQINATNGIYIQNSSGIPLQRTDFEQISTAQTNTQRIKSTKTIANGAKDFISTVKDIADLKVIDISVSTMNFGGFLNRASLFDMIRLIIQQDRLHPDSDAIITVNPGGRLAWDIEVKYERSR